MTRTISIRLDTYHDYSDETYSRVECTGTWTQDVQIEMRNMLDVIDECVAVVRGWINRRGGRLSKGWYVDYGMSDPTSIMLSHKRRWRESATISLTSYPTGAATLLYIVGDAIERAIIHPTNRRQTDRRQ